MKRIGLGLLIASTACSAVPPPEPGAGAGPAAASSALPGRLVPAGYGTLRQDEFTVELRSGALLVKVTPLAEEVIRLAAPDTYARLHALARRGRDDALRSGGSAGGELFQVSFFSYEPETTFQPEDLLLLHQGRLLRPESVLALTPEWGAQRLDQQQVQSAIYVFRGPFDYDQTVTVRYGLFESDEWRRIVPRLQTERARVLARAGAGG